MTEGLERFIRAQGGGVYEAALAELKAGRKKSHWMWFIFPQLSGLGRSELSRRFAIKNLQEARAYLVDRILGSRLRACCAALLALPISDPAAVFGFPDDLKLFSSMTLFDRASPNDIFAKVLDKYFAGGRDTKSLMMLNAAK